MKNVLTIFFIFSVWQIQAQTYKFYQTDNVNNQLRLNTKTGEVYQVQNDGQKFLIHEGTSIVNEKENRYMLHKTKNMWTFILLDQFSGKLWQTHFSVDGPEYMGSIAINITELSESNKNTFSIQPMTSMYQFYLTNDDTGEMWQFQWNNEREYRWFKKL